MRIGFTIIYNGAHHLEHNGWGNRLAEILDMWFIVEGKAENTGSTSWCQKIPETIDDNTPELLEEIEEFYSPYRVHVCAVYEKNKDERVNVAISNIKDWIKPTKKVFLWQLDIDEQWTDEQMDEAEQMLVEQDADCGCFHANHFVGPDLVAKGEWGEGNAPDDPMRNAYRRLWRWKGQMFETHEPPVLEGGNGKEVLLPQRFNHYAYYFQKDVEFKEKYYGYKDLLIRWATLNAMHDFPQPISRLLDGYWGNSKTIIEKCVSK